jgi:serine/threonine-protein kinase
MENESELSVRGTRGMADDRDKDPFSTGAGLDVLSRVARGGGEALIGRVLGDYRVTAHIAEGGMSRVYRAERTDGSFERDVAIKVSPASGLSREFRERFLREQGMLAGLNHPNICQLYDAQVTDEGWPYIVMELVEGVPVDEWCRQRADDRDAVVRLMIEIADALAYAHARLIVHRDIKPSNVLVNAEGRPKLLDFGIAKLLEPDVTALTRVSPMTPRYASPEQLLGNEVTIGSDIYQLGLLFCEMLTGKAPNTDQTLSDAIQRAAAGHAMSLPAPLRRHLARELVLIIEQCLRAAPSDRYSDANALKRDLEAWLAGYPVSAAGQGAGYRFRKLLGRNRATATTAAFAIIAMMGGATWYTWQLREARASAQLQAETAARQAEHAGRVSEFLVDLLAAPAPENARGEVVTAREVLDRGVEKLDAVSGMEAGVRSSLLLTMARSYKSLGEYREALTLIDQVLAMRLGVDGEDPLWLAEALEEKGRILRLSGDLEVAQTTLHESLVNAKRTDSREARRRQASILDTLGVVATELDRYEEARGFYTQALEIRSAILGTDHVDTLTTLANLGGIYAVQDRYKEALPLYERAVTITEQVLGPDHPNLPPLLDGLSASYRNTGRIEEALSVTRRSVDLARRLHGPTHPEVAYTLSGLAILHGRGGDHAAAAEVTAEVVDILSAALGDDHPQTAFNRLRLANYSLRLRRYDEAEALIAEIRPVFEHSSSMRSGRATLVLVLARLYAQTARPLAAIEQYRLAAELRAELFGQDSPHVAEPVLEAAALQAETGDTEGAAASYRRGIAILTDAMGESHPEVVQHLESLAELLGHAGHEEEARALENRIAALRAGDR